MGIAVGTRFDHFEIIAPLGAGGMGEVYLALDMRLERHLAIKLLPLESTREVDRVRRFIQEAKAASSLNHPNIITIYEIGEMEGSYYIATELIEGQTLRHRLRENRPNLNDALNITLQIVNAVAAAHAAGIIHRDLKPENVMVRPDGLTKVLDFGLAKLTAIPTREVDTQADTMMQAGTAPGIIMGTLRYMSPEQARGMPVDARTDIFSIGVVLYEMITGRAPFSGETTSDVIAAILTAEPPPVTAVNTEAPVELQRIVSRALCKDKESRYQSSKDLLADLKTLHQDLEFSAKLSQSAEKLKTHHTGEVTPTPPSVVATGKFRPIHALVVLPAILLAAGIIWWFVAGRGDKTETTSPLSLKTAEVASWRSSSGEAYSIGSFSPDAKMMAFTSTKIGARNIWVKQTASGEAVQITKDEFGNESPIWSPDRNEVAFFSTRGNQPGIWRIPALGGSPSLVITLKDAGARPIFWSRNGTSIYLAR